MKIGKRFAMLLLPIMVVIGGTGCMGSENKVINHLEEKYGEKFVVEGKKEGSLLFTDYGKDKFFLYPEGKPELIFSAGEVKSKKAQFYDGYINALWGAELTQNLNDELKGVLPEDSEFKIFVTAPVDDVSMRNTSIYDYIENVSKDVIVHLVIGVKTENEPNISEYSEDLFKAFEVMRNLQTKYYSLSAGFVGKNEDISDYIRTADVNNVPWSNLKGEVYGELFVDDRLELQGPEELINHYEPFKE